MTVLMRSVSGIRGVVGSSLTPTVILHYTNAFIQVVGARKVVIGRDTRVSGELVENLVAAACCAAGVEALHLGIASTPTVEMMVESEKADGGIIITASHNPIEWNALKFLTAEGIFLDGEEIQKLFSLVDAGSFVWKGFSELAPARRLSGADDHHIDSILALPHIDADLIRSKSFKVAYDAVNGAGSLIVPELLRRLGCETAAINVTPDGLFPHPPEPLPENLTDLGKHVSKTGSQVGFATDPDADRCAIVDENGKPVGEEYTLALASRLVLSHRKGPITVNLSTSRMVEDLAAEFQVPVERSKVGEINVTVLMKANKSVIGGEGNGGVILPELHYGRDGVLAVAMILQLMAETGKTLSELVGQFRAYHIEKQKFPIQGRSLDNVFGRLYAKFQGAAVDEQDGLRFEWADRWVHLRASNTEPVVRVIAEAPEAQQARELCRQVREEIE